MMRRVWLAADIRESRAATGYGRSEPACYHWADAARSPSADRRIWVARSPMPSVGAAVSSLPPADDRSRGRDGRGSNVPDGDRRARALLKRDVGARFGRPEGAIAPGMTGTSAAAATQWCVPPFTRRPTSCCIMAAGHPWDHGPCGSRKEVALWWRRLLWQPACRGHAPHVGSRHRFALVHERDSSSAGGDGNRAVASRHRTSMASLVPPLQRKAAPGRVRGSEEPASLVAAADTVSWSRGNARPSRSFSTHSVRRRHQAPSTQRSLKPAQAPSC